MCIYKTRSQSIIGPSLSLSLCENGLPGSSFKFVHCKHKEKQEQSYAGRYPSSSSSSSSWFHWMVYLFLSHSIGLEAGFA